MAMCLIIFSTLFLSTFSLLEAKYNGFSVDLIHRDSPESPLYNPSLTSSQRLTNALHRSFHRAHHFLNHSRNLPSTYMSSQNGEYLMNISFGTPPRPTLVIVDTGSDLIWTQCQPCVVCFEQNSPIFNPKNSSSYKEIACMDPKCQLAMGTSSCHALGTQWCSYSMDYGDGSFTGGTLATDTLKLGKVSIPNTIFGCGHHNGGTFSNGSTGIIGLGGGELSFISQLKSSIQGKFSYCLNPPTALKKSSKINFGDKGLVSSVKGAPVVTTPIFPRYGNSFYFLTLKGISVGSEKLDLFDLGDPTSDYEGNIVIDSGTTLTFLYPDFYRKLESEVKRQINKEPLIYDPTIMLHPCYNSLSDEEIPEITMHFKNADLKLKSYNTFIQMKESIKCLAFVATQNDAVYGNLAQSNFLIGYDVVKNTVSFKPTDCTKL